MRFVESIHDCEPVIDLESLRYLVNLRDIIEFKVERNTIDNSWESQYFWATVLFNDRHNGMLFVRINTIPKLPFSYYFHKNKTVELDYKYVLRIY